MTHPPWEERSLVIAQRRECVGMSEGMGGVVGGDRSRSAPAGGGRGDKIRVWPGNPCIPGDGWGVVGCEPRQLPVDGAVGAENEGAWSRTRVRISRAERVPRLAGIGGW
jgi:hypothetical protein